MNNINWRTDEPPRDRWIWCAYTHEYDGKNVYEKHIHAFIGKYDIDADAWMPRSDVNERVYGRKDQPDEWREIE